MRITMWDNEYKDFLDEWKNSIGTKRAEELRQKYEILKLEQERKRNTYLFFISVLLALITLLNFSIALVDFFNCQH